MVRNPRDAEIECFGRRQEGGFAARACFVSVRALSRVVGNVGGGGDRREEGVGAEGGWVDVWGGRVVGWMWGRE